MADSWHKAVLKSILTNYRNTGIPSMPDAKYGVEVTRYQGDLGDAYWKIIGIHHLTPDQNVGNRNLYFEALDEAGNRYTGSQTVWVGWTWDGKAAWERADPVILDKPPAEPAGNISAGSNQTIMAMVYGHARSSRDHTDVVANLHTRHPDEPLSGGGGNGNMVGHHSFYIVYQKHVWGGEPEPTPPGPTPIPIPLPTFTTDEMKNIQLAIKFARGPYAMPMAGILTPLGKLAIWAGIEEKEDWP